MENTEKWYEHISEGAVKHEEVKVLWNINVLCDNVTEARILDIILIDKKERKGIIIDINVQANLRVGEKERKKLEKYQELKRKIGRLWKLKMVEVMLVVIRVLRGATKEFDKWNKRLRITNNVGVIQKIDLLGTAKILIKFLEM